MTLVLKATTKGQITLPVKWRRNFATNQYLVEAKGNILTVQPLDLKKATAPKEITVFDAIRDNKGKGIYAEDLQKILRKIKD